MLELRPALNEPIAQIFTAAHLLDQAVDAHLAGDRRRAGNLLREADDPKIWAYVDAGWGKGSRARYAFSIVADAPLYLPLAARPRPRMPTATTKREVKARDRLHCRFCNIPLIDPAVRRALVKLYPNDVAWPRTDVGKHAALMCMWLQYDHILPNSRGGDSNPDNIVLTCTACNFGRMDTTLAEGRLIHPFVPGRPRWPFFDRWDGLERLLSVQARVADA